MTAENFPSALRRLRVARGLSLAEVGQVVNYSRKAIWDYEQGRRTPAPDVVQALDNALAADGYLVQRAAVDVIGQDVIGLPADAWRREDAEDLAGRLAAEQPRAENALALAHAWLVTEPPQVYELAAGRRIGRQLVDELAERVHRIRLIDDHIGGHDTAALVAAELDATAVLLREASYDDRVGRRLLSVVAELCQIAGWTASDAGQHDRAQQLYLAGARAAHAADDAGGAASNLSSLAYQVANVGDPREAELLARSAVRGAAAHSSPSARALLLDRLAWAHARAGEATAAARVLDQVDEAFDVRGGEQEPLWSYWMNRDEIDVMRGRVWTQLHLPLRAVPPLETAIEAYRTDAPREAALYLTWLAEALLQAYEVDRAAEAATRAAELSGRAGSDRAVQRVARLARLLAPHRGQASVERFFGLLRAAS